MYLFCPECRTQFPAAGRCPRCSNRLISPGESSDLPQRRLFDRARPGETTFGGRVVVGCVIALGAHLGLHEWAAALLGLVGASPETAFGVNAGLRAAAVFLGGMFAGAGRENPFGGGLAVGVFGAFAFLFLDPYPDVSLDPLHLGLAGGIAVLGGWVGIMGHRVWPPAVVLQEPEDSQGSSLLRMLPVGRKPESSRPTQWWKVLLSAAIVLASVALADEARTFLRKMPVGTFRNFGAGTAGTSRNDFEIALMGIVAGAFLAGINTGAGLRHGLFAGILAGIGAVAMYRSQGDGAFPALDFLVEHLKSDTPTKVALALGSMFFLSGTLGGWMGGQLMPRIRIKKKMKAQD